MASRYRAQLDHFELDVETIDERHDNALVQHEFPGADGADLEDMGMKARELTLRTHWMNERVDEVESFLWWLRQHVEVELTHPQFGVVRGRIQSSSTRWTDADDAEIDVVFVEQMPAQDNDYMPDVVVRSDEAFVDGQSELMSAYSQDVQVQLGADAYTVLAQSLAQGQSVASQITSRIGYPARTFVGAVDTALSATAALADTLADPVDSIVGLVDYGSSLPGRVVSEIARTIERLATAGATTATLPSQIADSIRASADAMVAAVPAWTGYIRAQAALTVGRFVATRYQADQGARTTLAIAERTPAIDVLGNTVRATALPAVLSSNELEASLAVVMTMAQQAVDAGRPASTLKRMVRDIADHVSRIKLERERIVEITVQGPQPLHLVCHNNGLSFEAADRVLAINPQIRNPNFVDGVIRVYS